MDFVTAVKACFQRYATFSGRAKRPEYWYFFLFTFLGMLIAGVLDGGSFGHTLQGDNYGPVQSIFLLVILVPSLAVAARRLHDLGKSGWWMLITFIPIIGSIIFLIWMATKSSDLPNKYDIAPVGGI